MTKTDILINFKDFIESIIALDKTREYDYGKGKHAVNAHGEFPEGGSRWKTPRELAREKRDMINKLLLNAALEESK
jgi:hypothetical protein